MPHAHRLDANQIERLQALGADFFRLSSFQELHGFRNTLAEEYPVDRAFAFLLDAWTQHHQAGADSRFLPHLVLTEDLSAGMLGERPVIFMGTNYWAAKPYLSLEYCMDKVSQYAKQLQRVREIFGNKKIVLAIVPEKDYIIDKHFLRSGRFQFVEEALSHLGRLCAASDVPLVFNEYVAPLREYEADGDFSYFDTHLPGRHYTQIFSHILGTLGHQWQDIAQSFTMIENSSWGDLQRKFGYITKRLPLPMSLNLKIDSLTIDAGMPSFGEPLGATWQSVHNESPLLPGKALVLGDSHSSILAQKRLTYLFAATFEKCLFYWNPGGLRQNPDSNDADYVILEISLRFLL